MLNKCFKTMLKNKKIIFIIIPISLFTIILYTRHLIISHSNIPVVDVVYCAKGDIENTLSASGYITAEKKVVVQPKVSGEIQEIYVEDGEKVKKGDKLIRLSQDEIEARIKQAESQLKSAKANLFSLHNESMEEQAKANLQTAKSNLQKAEKDLKSYDVLYKEKVISKEQYDNIVYQYNQAKIAYNSAKKQYELVKNNPTPHQRKIAEAQIEQAEIQLKYLREQLKETTIFSPMDGVVVFNNVGNLNRNFPQF
jgi:multidrug resistance efflux pump